MITSDEMKALSGVINNLVAEKRDVYKINGLNIVPRNILYRITLLDTGEIVNIFYKMRETPDLQNEFMYLMTALYNNSSSR